MNETSPTGYIMTENSITVYCKGQIHTISRDAAKGRWNNLIACIKEGDWDTVLQIIDVITAAKEFISGSDIKIKGRVFCYLGKPLDNSLTRRIIQMMEEGFEITPMVNFLRRVMRNPSNRAINELYLFLEESKMPITPDGYFIAYKRIREDWTDCYSGKISNRPGQKPSMPRNEVDDDANRTCSSGLHFCSLGYLQHFWGERLIAIKVDPQNVVAIPRDYENSKGRCCEYEVIKELNIHEHLNGSGDTWKAVYEEDDDDDDELDQWGPCA